MLESSLSKSSATPSVQPGFVSPYSPAFFSPSPFCCIFQSTKRDTRELSKASLPPWQVPERRGVIQDSVSPFKNIPTRFSLLRISMSSVWSVPGALGTEQKQPHEQGESRAHCWTAQGAERQQAPLLRGKVIVTANYFSSGSYTLHSLQLFILTHGNLAFTAKLHGYSWTRQTLC